MTDETSIPSEMRSVSILIVDDDEDNRAVLDELLSEEGYTVACARDGADALALLRRVRPDIILLDVNMPIMNGLEFRAAQRRDPALATIPTVVMTALPGYRNWIGELAPAETVRKPVKLADLLTVVRRYARGTRDSMPPL